MIDKFLAYMEKRDWTAEVNEAPKFEECETVADSFKDFMEFPSNRLSVSGIYSDNQ